MVHCVIQGTVTAPVLRGQRQPGQGLHRPVRAQHRISQLKQGIRPRREAAVKLTAEGRQPLPLPIAFRPWLDPLAPATPYSNATATAIISGLFGRNPKMITRWLCHVMAARQDKITNLRKAGPRG